MDCAWYCVLNITSAMFSYHSYIISRLDWDILPTHKIYATVSMNDIYNQSKQVFTMTISQFNLTSNCKSI